MGAFVATADSYYHYSSKYWLALMASYYEDAELADIQITDKLISVCTLMRQ